MMKTQKLFLSFLLLAFVFSGSLVQAQSKSKKEKAQQEKKIVELEKRLEKAMKVQELELEKVLRKSKKFQDEELEKILENSQKARQQARKEYIFFWDGRDGNYRRAYDIAKERNKNPYMKFKDLEFDIDTGFVFDGDEFRVKTLSYPYFATNKGRTSLTIHKELDEVTFETKFKYELNKGSSGINFLVDGRMDEGTLLIKLIKPNGDVLQEIEVSPLADISWNQELRWDKKELDENIGSWLIVVSADNASGQYSVNVRAN